jgi:hypothetical protein
MCIGGTSSASPRLLQLLVLELLRLDLLEPPLLVKPSDLPFHLSLLQLEVIACDL